MFPLLAAFTFILYVVATPVANTTPLDLEIEVPPNSDTNLRLEKRHIGGVYICSGTNWGGKCGYAVQPLDTCIVLGSDWKNKIASFGPDSCTMCFAYKSDNCAFGDGFFWMFQHPGDASGGRSVINNAWNKHIGSFRCWRSPDC